MSWGGGQPTTSPPAAWYPDPSGVGELRYWNGWSWTPGVVIGGQVTERPMPWPPVAAQHGVPPDTRPAFPGRAAFYGLAGFVVGVIVGLLLALVAEAADAPDAVILLLNLAGLWGGLLGACVLASRRYGSGNIGRDFGLQFAGKDFSWGLLMSLAARVAGAIVLIPFLFGSDDLLRSNQGVYGEVRETLPGFLVFATVAVVGAPLVEELFFRGLLLRSLTTAMGTGLAIATQAVLFGLAHFSPLLGVANFAVVTVIAAAGVVFGLTAWWRRVGTSVAAHAFYNLVAVLVAGFAPTAL